MARFTQETISDAKRLVRGEHWLAVRTFLRRRDRLHHARWKIVTLAGGHPCEEFACIRHLMPKAIVVAIDREQRCCEAAIDAGANDVLCTEMLDWSDWHRFVGNRGGDALPERLSILKNADAINLDICGPATCLTEAVRRYAGVARRGAILATVSYGRDVAEIYEPGPYRGIPEPIGGRVRLLDEQMLVSRNLVSVLAYPGNEMPMVSCLWLPYGEVDRDEKGDAFYKADLATKRRRLAARKHPSFERVADVDLVSAVEHLDAASLYGLPSERIEAMRRSASARKAVVTRINNQAQS